MKKYIIWDFDGVIVNSDEIRVLGFREVLQSYPKDQVEELIEYHQRNGGLSRYNKFRYFYEEILNKEITEEKVGEYAQQFSKIMLEKMTDKAILIQGTVNFIEENYQKFDFYIASGSDQTELRYLCEQLGVAGHFKDIFGSPTPKNELVKNIIAQTKANKEDYCMIGDAINDYDAATVNGIRFFGFNNPELRPLGAGYIDYFKDFKFA